MGQRARLVVEKSGEICVAYIQDSAILDENNIKALAEELMTLAESRNKVKILINFEKVEYLSSAVLGKLIALHKKVAEMKGSLKLCGIRDTILEVFRVTKLDKFFDIYDSQQKAMKSFKSFSLFRRG
ncbi:MAG: STAS domain-containing protein [Planctomycetota bacterium]|nr:STAS domain-containing protein [Planctomycetota bacterium]